MIEVRNLVKIYSQNKSKQCRALDGVNFVLPDKGMVFVVGKSGSGKSTLLNMLGGLDRLTEGDIIVDGRSFVDFKQRDFDDYHCNYLGFVFQDFCLIDSLTIRENIAMALKLQGSLDYTRVDEILSQLDMNDYAQRLPNELSGGQKQRVAIARALIKNPKLILADEPTGNLDSKTGEQTLKILKKISEYNLVVIVSHSIADAEEYADRIIELADGHVVKDVVRSGSAVGLTITDSEIAFSKGTVFTDEQIRQINSAIKSNADISFRQTDSKFAPTGQLDQVPQPTAHAHDNVRTKSKCGKDLFKIFIKKRIVNQVVTTLLVACLIIVLGVCQLFTQFNADEQVESLLRQGNNQSLVLKKGYLSDDIYNTVRDNVFVRVTDEDIQRFYDDGYQGNIYKLYNAPILMGPYAFSTELAVSLNTISNCSNFYTYECRGVLACDEQFLTSLYGVDGKLDYVGNLDTTGNRIVITDYIADSLLYYNPDYDTNGNGYENILKQKLIHSRFNVCAIINTDYRNRYKDLIDIFVANNGKTSLSKQDLTDNELFQQFISESDYSLNIGYSLNPNYGEELKIAGSKESAHRVFAHALTTDFYDENGNKVYESYGSIIYEDVNLTNNQMLISKSYYSDIMGVPKESVGEEIIGEKLSFVMFDNGGQDVILTIQDVEIVGICNFCIYMSTENFEQFISYDQFPYALYFDNDDLVMTAFETGTDNYFLCSSTLFNSIYTVAQAVDIFADLFGLVVVILCVLSVVLLVTSISGGVKKSAYEIGVLRALGATNHSIAIAYALQAVLIGIAIAVLAFAGLVFGAGFCNDLLVDGFVKFTGNPSIKQINIIDINFATVATDVAVTLVLSCITGFAPFALLRKIKPTEIIRSKD